MVPNKKFGLMVVLILAVIFISPKFGAFAQDDYPNKYVEIVMPYPPGGPGDLSLRFFADKWAEFLGQPVIIVNKPGAGGAIGAKFAAQAKPDGYTLMCASDSPLIVARIGRKDLGYDLDSFRLLFYFSKIRMFFSVKSDSKWKTMSEFIKEAKDNPGKLKYSTYGVGGATHYAVEMLSKVAGVKLTLVPFKGGVESTTALIAGNVDMAVTMGLLGLAGSGKIRPLAISEEERAPDFPNVPTLKELGYYIGDSSMYIGLASPSKIPEKVALKWNDANDKVRKKYEKEIKDKLPNFDQYPTHMDGATGMQILRAREKVYSEFAAQVGKID